MVGRYVAHHRSRDGLCGVVLMISTAEQLHTANEYVKRTHDWIMADRERFNQVERAFLYLDHKGAPIQQGRVHAELLRLNYRLTDNDIFRNDRNMYPTLARYLRALHPRLKESVRIRKSTIDKLALPPIPKDWALDWAVNTDRWLIFLDWQ